MEYIQNNKFYKLENNKVGIEVRNIKEFSPNDNKLLELSKLNNYSTESWTATGSNADLGYFTHGIFRYFGKFPPVIATHLITQYTDDNDYILDPMCGSGTTGVESLFLKRKSTLNDINPLSLLISKVKTHYIKKEVLEKELQIIQDNYKPLSIEEYNFEPVGLKDYHHWFLPKTCDSLRGLKFEIEKINQKDVKEFFYVCFCSIIRSVSLATSQQGRLFLDVNTAKEDCLDTFIKKCQKNIEAIQTLPHDSDKNITFMQEDVKKISMKESKNKYKLIILHPPYFNSYKYSSINSLELSWIGRNQAEIRKNEIHEFFKVGQAKNVTKYVEDMNESLRNLYTSLSEGGTLALMIGDTIIKEEYIPVTKLLLEKVSDIFSVEKVILRVPKYTEASWAASQRRKKNDIGVNLNDFIIILRRK